MSAFKPVVRTFDAILEALPRNPEAGRVPRGVFSKLGDARSDYLRVLRLLGKHEFAGDFVFLGLRELGSENRLRDCPRVRLGEDWWIFGIDGQGNGWLLSLAKGSSDVAFLDHEDERRATAEPLGINFRQWVQLADLMGQVERAEAADDAILNAKFELVPRAKKLVRAQMAKIAPSFPRCYPYRL